MTNPTPAQNASAIAHLAVQMRPTGAPRWDTPGVVLHVLKLLERERLSIYEIADRTFRHAQDPNAKTPGVLASPAHHKPELNAPYRPPKAGEVCPLHPGEWLDTCRSCAGDRLAGDSPGADVAPGLDDSSAGRDLFARVRQAIDLQHALTPTIEEDS